MLEIKDVEKLAKLSRIEIEENEKDTLRKDFEAILGYISEIQEVVTGDIVPEAGILRNIMREDVSSHKSGKFSKEIIEEVPDKKNNYIKVKKIL